MEDNRTDGQINGNLSINTQFHKIRTGNRYVPEVEEITYGLTKREYFAGLMLQGLIANSSLCPFIEQRDRDTLVKEAVIMSDMLLEKLGEIK